MTTAQPPRYSDILAAAKAAALDALQRGDGLEAAARAAIDAAEDFLAHAVEAIGLHEQMAAIRCAAGCSHCCHQMVGVTSAELALLRRAIDALPPSARGRVRARIKKVAARGKGLDQRGWWLARLRCPLLEDDGKCLAHADRPLPCRAMNSYDVDICRRSHGGERLQVPMLAAQHRIHAHAQTGLIEALKETGADPAIHVMGLALA